MSATPLAVFDFISRGQHLSVRSGQLIDTPLSYLDLPDLFNRYKSRDSTQVPIICGIIPFNTHAPSHLFHTGDYSLHPVQQIPQSHHSHFRLASPTCQEQQEEDRRQNHYKQAVQQALTEIGRGDYQKIVVAWKRSLRLESYPQGKENFDQQVFTELYRANPAADVFRVRTGPDETWLGASPEILADLQTNLFTTHPLAGSLSRSQAKTHEQARKILLHSAKDLGEHAFVVDHIAQALQSLPGVVATVPSTPGLTATDSMWHLGTPITANVPLHTDSLKLAAAIHPTPAVCGAPLHATYSRIRQLEDEPRSYFSGLVGWADAIGRGRWSLVLRCAQRKAENIHLFAGAGIVAGSTPEQELQETQAKMQTVLNAITAASNPNTSTSGKEARA